MSNEETENKKLTWKEKIEQGLPLNRLEETQADADFNFHQRQREEAAKRDHEKSKQAQVQPSEETNKKGK